MDTFTYFVRKESDAISIKDMLPVLTGIKTFDGVGITKNSTNEYHIFYEKMPYKAFIRERNGEVDLEIGLEDQDTYWLVKFGCEKFGFRLFSKELDSYVPMGSLLDTSLVVYKEIVNKVFFKRDLKPLFHIKDTSNTYALHKSGEIHYINADMVGHCMDFNITEVSDDFSYKVADDLDTFILKMDAGLIPESYYEYQNKSHKIIDLSRFGIENPGKKVFIKPYIFELNKENSSFVMLSSERGALIYMDKILPNENLDKALKRLLKEHLKIATDYVGAVVLPNLEYDKDKNGILIPRLLVRVYLANHNLTEKFKGIKDRQWIPNSEVKY